MELQEAAVVVSSRTTPFPALEEGVEAAGLVAGAHGVMTAKTTKEDTMPDSTAEMSPASRAGTIPGSRAGMADRVATVAVEHREDMAVADPTELSKAAMDPDNTKEEAGVAVEAVSYSRAGMEDMAEGKACKEVPEAREEAGAGGPEEGAAGHHVDSTKKEECTWATITLAASRTPTPAPFIQQQWPLVVEAPH